MSFAAPASNGGAAITAYTVTSSPCAFTATGDASPITLTGLANGTSYSFVVAATNSAGADHHYHQHDVHDPYHHDGRHDDLHRHATGRQLDAPQFRDHQRTDGRGVRRRPVRGGRQERRDPDEFQRRGVDQPGERHRHRHLAYRLRQRPLCRHGRSRRAEQPGRRELEEPPQLGQPSHGIQALGYGAGGNYVFADATGTADSPTRPGAPTGVAAVAGTGSATVPFNAPANDGGRPVTGYVVTASPGGISASGAASPVTVTGVTDGIAYTFTVAASNGVGTSAPSAASNAVTTGVVSLNLLQGWNLAGNGSATPLDVAALFGDATGIATVWKWQAASARWALYTPSFTSQELAAYAAGKGYDVLGGIATLWAWDSARAAWYFYAPSLDAAGGLASYISGKGYRDFTANQMSLGPRVGFWVNRP